MSNTSISTKQMSIPWIEKIPDRWEVRKLKTVFKYVTGATPDTGKNNYYSEEGFNWITISDLNGRYTKESKNKITQLAVEQKNMQIVPKGSLLYSFKLSVGQMSFVELPTYTNEAIFAILPNKNLNLNFWYYALQTYLINSANENIYGAKIFNQDSIDNAFLISPPLHTQKNIAKYLDEKTAKIKKLIDDKKKMIELLKEQKQSIIYQSVTKGIKEMKKGTKMKDSGIEWIGEIPKEWEVQRLKMLSNIKRGASPRPIDDKKYFDENGEFAWVRIADVTNNNIFLEKTTQQLSRLGASLSVKQYPGDLFLSIAGTVGKPMFANIKCCIHDGFVTFSDLNNKVEKKFLFYILNSGQAYFGLGKEGSQLNLNIDTVGNISIPLPSLQIQKHIVAHIEKESNKINIAITKIEQEIELIKEYKKSLVYHAVTGKITKLI